MQDTPLAVPRPMVLVIDDTPQNLAMMRDLLDPHYVVKLAPSGARGLEIATATKPDLILLDVMMPDMDGYEVCRRLKATPNCVDIPVIFVTAMTETENEEEGLALGAVDYLTKPISPPIVLARVRSQLALKAAADLLRTKNSLLATAHKELAAAHEHTQQTQQQLILKEKMAGLGTLTAGVAHEINNPTNFVQVAAQNLRVDVIEFQQFIGSLIEADEAPDILLAITERFAKLSGHINTMLNGTERIKTIVKDLRAVTRHDQSEKTTIRMSECLLSTLNLVRSNWHEQIDFISEFIDDPEITCWPALLNQVFMNLLVNAAQSITERAKLDSTERGRICIRTQINGDKLKIDFSDNGIGMSPELQTRILEPFFTTKAVGAGTGLGLSISYGIILQHAGELQIHSTLGRGSCFSVRLPLSEQAPDASN